MISSAVFDPIAHLYLPHLRVIAYDHRGTGRSGAWPAPVSAAMLAADAASVLDDRGIATAHVVGLSLGAGVALELAIRMTSRVKSSCSSAAAPARRPRSLPGCGARPARSARSPRARSATGAYGRPRRSSRRASGP